MSERIPHITIIGGGSGSRAVLAGLRPYDVAVTAVVNMSDNGGSTGVLRDELGILPPGDIRQAISGLSTADPEVVDMFNSRYGPHSRLAGHSLGNILLADMTQRLGDFGSAVEAMSRAMQVKGSVIPSTRDIHDLVLQTPNDLVRGEYQIGETPLEPLRVPPKLWLEPEAKVEEAAEEAIARSDVVVIAPGDLYGSLVPPLLLGGMKGVLEAMRDKVVYIGNLVNKPHQTAGFGPLTYAQELERLVGEEFIRTVVFNTAQPSEEFLTAHAKPGEEWVRSVSSNACHRYDVQGADLLSTEKVSGQAYEAITRSYVRHDPAKLAPVILAQLERL